EVRVNLVARNILKGTSSSEISGLTGNRPVFSQLYLVTEDATVAVLEPQSNNPNLFKGIELTLETSFQYKIAEKLHADNSIDYSGDVFGNMNGKLAMINENGEFAFSYTPEADY